MNTLALKRCCLISITSCSLITACHQATKPSTPKLNPALAKIIAKKDTHTCFKACERTRRRCNTLCQAANEECTSNARYLAAFAMRQQHKHTVNAKHLRNFLNAKQCDTHCGCIPSRTICFQVCQDGKKTP